MTAPSAAEITRRALGGAQLAPTHPGTTLLCTEDPDCRLLARWKVLTVRRGRRWHWTGRATCDHHIPRGSVAA